MQKAQLAAALVAALGFALGGTAYAADTDNGMNVTEKSTKTEKHVKLAKGDKTTTEKGAEGSCKGKESSCKGKESSCKGKEGSCKGKEGKKHAAHTKKTETKKTTETKEETK